jgi:acyl dehydratase
MLGPVKHGDTIRLVQKVVEKKETSKPDRGVVTFQRQCVKQDGSVVQEMKATLMYKRRPQGLSPWVWTRVAVRSADLSRH